MKLKSKRAFSILIVLLLFVAVITILHATRTHNLSPYENRYYSFSYPKDISIEERLSPGFIEIDFFLDEEIGGVCYYPTSNWDDFYALGSSSTNMRNTDTEVFLQEQGILQADEFFDSYVFDIGVDNRSASLWEQRSDIEREHFLFFTEAGPCYDLWFYCDKLNNPEKTIIIESFQLEVST